MPDNPFGELLGLTLRVEDEGQFRIADVNERSVRNTLEFDLQPENPDADRLGKSLTPEQLESFTARDDVTEGVPDPRRVHQNRSTYAQRQDEARNAQLTTDPREYANDPDSLDFPGVDTGPAFRDVQGEDFDTGAFIDRVFEF